MRRERAVGLLESAAMLRSPDAPLRESLESGRVHAAWLLSGPGPEPRSAALDFARGLVCTGAPPRPCEACPDCRRSRPAGEPIALDGAGKRGPLLRHVGDHPDLVWVERGPDDTRVRIGQIRAVQHALRLRSHEGGWRAAVIADAEWLNVEAQNALLRTLEEPPPRTCIVLVAASAAGLLATLRSRCQRAAWPPPRPEAALGPDAPAEVRKLARRIEALPGAGVPQLLDWAEEFRGARGDAAAAVERLLETGSAWLHARTRMAAREGGSDVGASLEAFATLARCRRALAQRNANPQMVAERALLALREAAAR
jgi:DNA polymerase-3 subunit delta'